MEKHHILPLHAGGDDHDENLVYLTYIDHIGAHFVRWIAYGDFKDKMAYILMASQSSETRIKRAQLAGQKGGSVAQTKNRLLNKARFNSEEQRQRGIKGAAKNRQQGTGAWDAANLKKANEVLRNNNLYVTDERLNNLEKGRQTQKSKSINIYNPVEQRRKSLTNRTILLAGQVYFLDKEQRTYLTETTFEYYLIFGEKKRKKAS